MDIKDLSKMRDTFKELTDICNEVIDMDKREEAGEDIPSKDAEALMGRFMYKLLELNTLAK
jgi:hypothetical protein